ncbi:universal stress protein [Pontixanthobacter gangjinensis]|uniref:Universal stress protein n=1 Tax=Pontixanthobacter gangjinensis TaxID=1028742 RepID=A0A6I4SNS9_9SPHN|nr:universal stress protein [Pontixanthobacter gangjinensis]MXO57475.1 universal stress protein [Pontixanthobacter gangjinensis]
MQSILVHVYNDPGIESRLQIALDMARAYDAHLTFLQVVLRPVILPGDYSGIVAAQMMPVAQEQADELRRVIEARLEEEDVRWNWVQEADMTDDMLMSHAALNDLVLVGCAAPQQSSDAPSRLAGTLAIRGRSPVMVAPLHAKSFDPAKPALVAWNGSREASHALRASLSMLKHSSTVYLATVVGEEGPSREGLPAIDGAAYLSRHGISCEVVELPCHARHPAEVLLEAAMSREAGYIVLGAYGHARLFEMIFGGVTRRMLKDPPIPLVLAH